MSQHEPSDHRPVELSGIKGGKKKKFTHPNDLDTFLAGGSTVMGANDYDALSTEHIYPGPDHK